MSREVSFCRDIECQCSPWSPGGEWSSSEDLFNSNDDVLSSSCESHVAFCDTIERAMSQSLVAKPTINSEDHGAKVVLCGALMITPIVMMASMSFYNRMRAKSLLHLDGLVAFAGTVSS